MYHWYNNNMIIKNSQKENKNVVIKTDFCWQKTKQKNQRHRWMQYNGKPRRKPTNPEQTNFQQWC
jgi:hypothetical protein